MSLFFLSYQGQRKVKSASGHPLYTLDYHHMTGIEFKNNLREALYMNRLFYECYYKGGGVAIGGFNNDDLQDIYFISNLEPNKLYINQGNLDFYVCSSEKFKNPYKGRNEFDVNLGIDDDGILRDRSIFARRG